MILAISILFFLTVSPLALGGDKYIAAAYYFPGYHPTPQNDARLGLGWTEWDLVRAARPRFPGHSQPKQPLWGYFDESRPEVFSPKIAAAAGHGVDVLLFDWYWHNTGPFLERALEQGFLKAKNRDRVRFALMWANHDWIDIFPAKLNQPQKVIYPGAVTRETFDKATGHIMDRYFSQANYWKIDGRPYFSIYELMTLVRGLGGVPQTRRALDSFRARARAAGLPGIHLNAVAWGVKPEGLAKDGNDLLKQLGFDSVTSYCWIHHTGLPKFPETSYPDWAPQAEKQWDLQTRQWQVPYHPNISMGWDSSPRTTQSDPWRPAGYPYGAAVQKNTPAEFQKSLQRLKKFLDARPDGQRIFTINAWNEWTEGSYLEPDVNHKFEYLEAIRKVMGSE
jgi:hypothetical protein